MIDHNDAWANVDEETACIERHWRSQPPTRPEIPVLAGGAPIDLRVIERAVARYMHDEQLVEADRRSRKELKYKGRRDVHWLLMWAKRIVTAYDMVTSFVGMHIGGFVRRDVVRRRAAYCERCTHRRRRYSPNANNRPADGPVIRRDRCRGWDATGRPCDCPDDPLWRPSSLAWQLSMTALRTAIAAQERRLLESRTGVFDVSSIDPKRR